MKTWTDISDFKAKNPVVTVGSFDGLHLGHLEVISQLKQVAKTIDGESVVFTFWPHPSTVLFPDKKLSLLNTVPEKIKLFEQASIDHLVLFPFTREFSQLSYQQFVADILIEKIGLHTLLVGHDNKMGHNREGDNRQLTMLGHKLGFKLLTISEVQVNNDQLNSTRIRNLLSQGKVFEASEYLGYPYIVSGTVVRGQQLGQKLGFPTANLDSERFKLIPANGVYVIRLKHQHTSYNGVMNIGTRPTVQHSNPDPVLEAHLFDFNGNLYGEFVTVQFVTKLRNEQKFNSLDELIAQISLDKQNAIDLFSDTLLD